MKFKDYYGVLGVARGTGTDEIKKAYRRLARKHHPDLSKEAGAEQRMSEVNEAYAVLSDAEKRAAYDRLGEGRQAGETFSPPPGWDAGFEFSGSADGGDEAELFAELFKRMGRGRPRGARHAPGTPWRGDDHHAAIVLAIEDAWQGAQKRLQLQLPQWGTDGRLAYGQRTLEVKIPVGVRPGQLIRLAGQGGPGGNGGPAGDLLLEVQFEPHPRFRLDGSTLVTELPLAPWEATLGAVVPVPMPDGSLLKVNVPAGAQPGRRLTVRGKGLPAPTPGDLELLLRVVLPSAHDPRARRLFEQMAAELGEFDARKVAAAEDERSREEAAP